MKLLCFISFDNSKHLVYEYSKIIDWIGGCIGTVEHQTSQCSPPVKTIDGSAEHHSRVGELRCMSQAAASKAPDKQSCASQATRIASEPT